jgi:copper chaperone CopZ
MKHTYKISGMTCAGCQAKVQKLLANVNGVTNVTVDLDKGQGHIEMSRHIPVTAFQKALHGSHYSIAESHDIPHEMEAIVPDDEQKSWLATYKPILLIFAYILITTLAVEFTAQTFDGMRWMRHFMAGFFLTFSFFKLLDLPGFADSYSTYDVIASKWRGWGYVYAFVELGLGVAFLLNFQPLLTNIATFVVMGVSIIGVVRSVMNKRKIRCACLGAVFNLPMSTVTIIEDALMIVMSGAMIYYLI